MQWKHATGANKLQFSKKDDLFKLKPEVGKLDITKLETAPFDLSKLSDVVKNEVVKKNKYDELVKILISTQTVDSSNLVKKSWL